MSPLLALGLAFVLAFAVGSIPIGLWVGRAARGIDVRDHGSGNLGATNVYRTLGPAWGVVVLLLDAAKGAGAVFAARALSSDPGPASGMIGMLGSFLGHMFTPFAGFRGGKGVATAAGAWAALVPWALAVSLGSWILVFARLRVVSVASLVATGILPIAVAFSGHAKVGDPLLWLAVLTFLFIAVRHRSNLRRILRGEEKALSLRGPRSPV